MKLNGLQFKKSGIINNMDLFYFLIRKTIHVLTLKKIINIIKIFFSKIFWIKLNTEPYFILTDPVNTCNLDCSMCFTKQIKHKEKTLKYYNALEFEKILKKYSSNLIYIMFGCLWEPTLNKDIYRMLELCKKYKVLPFLTTNFVDCNINELIKCEIPYIQISISAGDKNSYINIHGKDFFEKVKENLNFITKKRNNIYIHVKSVLQKSNEDLNTIKRLRKFLKKIKVNKFSLKKFQSVRDISDNKEILPKNKDFFDKKSGILRFSTDKRSRNQSMCYIGPDTILAENEAVYLLKKRSSN